MNGRSLYLQTVRGVETKSFETPQPAFLYIMCTGATERSMSIRLPRDEANKLYAMLGKELNANRMQTERVSLSEAETAILIQERRSRILKAKQAPFALHRKRTAATR